MTLTAIFKWDDNLSMPCRNLIRVVSEKGKEHFYPFNIRRVVTFMAVNTFVGTLRPLCKGSVHKMACLTEIRIVLSVIVCLVTQTCNDK